MTHQWQANERETSVNTYLAEVETARYDVDKRRTVAKVGQLLLSTFFRRRRRRQHDAATLAFVRADRAQIDPEESQHATDSDSR